MKQCIITYESNDLLSLSANIQRDIDANTYGSIVSCSHSIYAPVREPNVFYKALVVWSGK